MARTWFARYNLAPKEKAHQFHLVGLMCLVLTLAIVVGYSFAPQYGKHDGRHR